MRQSLPADPSTEGSRDALLPRLGHELGGPVQVILGFVDLLLAEQAGPLTPEQRRYLEQTRHGGERLARFARELAAGLETATAPVRPRIASLAPVLESVAGALKPLLERRGQVLRIRIAADAGEAVFDPARIEQVLHNLIVNASEHGPVGGAIDLVAERTSGATGSELVVSVTDDGPGLPEGAPARPGRGLGLEICQAIVAAHGGRLESARAPGRGARVSFALPGAASPLACATARRREAS